MRQASHLCASKTEGHLHEDVWALLAASSLKNGTSETLWLGEELDPRGRLGQPKVLLQESQEERWITTTKEPPERIQEKGEHGPSAEEERADQPRRALWETLGAVSTASAARKPNQMTQNT